MDQPLTDQRLTDLRDVVDELYGVQPGAFTSTRNERAKQAKGGGDAELAKRVRQLRKPATAAWVVNMLMRHQGEQMEQVLALGEALRQAQEDLNGEALRALTRQRRQLITAVSNQGRSLAADLGQRVSDAVTDQVQETLHAAMVDQGAAAAVRSGMLTEPLTATGVGVVDPGAVVAVPEAIGAAAPRVEAPAGGTAASGAPDGRPKARRPGLRAVPRPEPGEAEREEARREAVRRAHAAVDQARADVERARAEDERATRKLDKWSRRLDRLEARSLQLQGQLDELRRRMAELEHDQDAVDDEIDAAESKRDRAQERQAGAAQGVEAAEEALTRAQDALAEAERPLTGRET